MFNFPKTQPTSPVAIDPDTRPASPGARIELHQHDGHFRPILDQRHRLLAEYEQMYADYLSRQNTQSESVQSLDVHRRQARRER